MYIIAIKRCFLALVEHFRCTWPLPFIQCPLQATLLVTTANITYGLEK